MVEAYAQFFIHKRSVRTINDISKDRIRILNAQHVLLPHQFRKSPAKLSCHTQTVDLLIKDACCIVHSEVLVPKSTEILKRSLQERTYQRKQFCRLGLGKPQIAILGLVKESIFRSDYRFSILQVNIQVQNLQEATVTVCRIDTCRSQNSQCSRSLILDLLSEVCHDLTTGFTDLLEIPDGIHLILINLLLLHKFLSLRRFESECHIQQIRVHAVTSTLCDLLEHIVCKPCQKTSAVLGQRIQNSVHAFSDKRILVQLHLIGSELSDLARERLQRLLEELVNCTHGKGAVVMENILEHRL